MQLRACGVNLALVAGADCLLRQRNKSHYGSSQLHTIRDHEVESDDEDDIDAEEDMDGDESNGDDEGSGQKKPT
jgi:hypothetical protein